MEDINTIHSVRKYVLVGISSIVVLGLVIGGIVLLTSNDTPRIDNIDNTQPQDVVDSVNDPDPIPDDVDRDGLSDTTEQELGLSVVNPDTDADGLFDNDEMTVWKSDPLKFDTDGDGFGDGWEVLKGYNPAGPGLLSIENN